MGDDPAVDELIRRASDPAVSPESLREAIGPALATLSPDDRPGAEAMLRAWPRRSSTHRRGRMWPGRSRSVRHPRRAGAGPDDRTRPDPRSPRSQIAPEAIAFVAACRHAAEDEPPPTPRGEGPEEGKATEQTDPTERHGERIAALMPTEARVVPRSRADFPDGDRDAREVGRGPEGLAVADRSACIARRARRPVWLRRPALDDDAGARRRADRGAAPGAREGLPGPNLGTGRQLPAAHPAGRRADRPVLEPLAPRPSPGAGRGRGRPRRADPRGRPARPRVLQSLDMAGTEARPDAPRPDVRLGPLGLERGRALRHPLVRRHAGRAARAASLSALVECHPQVPRHDRRASGRAHPDAR